MAKIVIKDRASLEMFFDSIISESVSKAKKKPIMEDYAELQREADDEKEKQARTKAAKNDVDSLFGDMGGGEEEQSAEQPKQQQKDSGDGTEDMGDLGSGGGDTGMIDTSDAAEKAAKAITVTADVDGIVNLLNLIRSGRSLKQANILEELTKWLEDMSDAQKLFTVTVLTGIKDIVTAGDSADEAHDVDDAGVNVTMSKEEDVDVSQQKKSPGDTGEAPARSQVTSVEDTSAPIVVGRRNEAYMRAYRDKIKKLMGD